MATMQLADTTKLPSTTSALVTEMEKSMGLVPNIVKQMANSPAALDAFLLSKNALANGLLDKKMAPMIGILVAEIYSCEYLLAARVAAAKKAGLTDEEIKDAKIQSSKDAKIDLGLNFVRNIILRHAEIATSDMAELKAGGYSDGEIVELIQHASQNMFVYYLIQVAEPVLDFPEVATAFPV